MSAHYLATTDAGQQRADEVAEWLRRWTANPLGSARVGSNPILVARLRFYGVMVSTLDFESSDPSSNLGRTSRVLASLTRVTLHVCSAFEFILVVLAKLPDPDVN